MRAQRRIPIVLSLIVTATLLAAGASAQNLYWFGNGAVPGGNGNWSAAGATTWSTTTPVPSIVIWDPTQTAVFGGLVGTVTVADPNVDAAAGMSFETDLYTLTGGSVTLTGANVWNNSINANALVTATTNSVIKGTAGLKKLGPGTFVLGAVNLYTGETWIDGGTLGVTGSINTSDKVEVGYDNPLIGLSITGGGSATCTQSFLAVNTTSSGNTATVSGTGSLWANTTDLVIGYRGVSNSLTVSSGGNVTTTNGSLGYFSTSSGNSVLVTGTNSKWSDSNVLYVGVDGGGNTFSVESAGYALSSKDAVVGFHATSTNNALKVKDAGSEFQVASGFTLIIGDSGSNNTLAISNGGVVTGNNSRLARSSGSSDNSVTVIGPVSAWNNTGTIRVGTLGPRNSVTVSAGGTAGFGGNAFIGYDAAAPDNNVTVTGAGSTWTSATLTVGLGSTGNVLEVRDGGSVTAAGGIAVAANVASGGTVNIGAGGAAGTLTGPITFGSGTGILNFNHTDGAYLFTSAITGPGAVRHIGSGTTIVSGPNTYSGGTTLLAGTLRLGADNALPNSGTFAFKGGTLAADDRTVALGELSLEADSSLAFGTAASRQDVVFASAAAYVGGTLTVTGWGGPSGSSYDRLIITSDPTGSGILGHIQFAGYPLGAFWLAGTGEVVPNGTLPVPTFSPAGVAVMLTLICAIGVLSLARRRRLSAS